MVSLPLRRVVGLDRGASLVNAELAALLASLDSQRRHVIEVMEALKDDERRTSTLPSGWSAIGLVRHLTLGGERYWFHSIVGGEPLGWFPEQPRADWTVAEDESTDDVLDEYRVTVERSNEHLRAADLDSPPGQRDPLWDEWGVDFPTVRVIVLHMIVETAVHAGHLDAAVELIDGRTRLVLDD